MQDKDMVLDVLAGAKSGLSTYAAAIGECANLPVRETLQKMRDQTERFQYDLYKMAAAKGFYPETQESSPQEISSVKAQLSGAAAQQQGAGPVL
jgi:spore coat protein CotF